MCDQDPQIKPRWLFYKVIASNPQGTRTQPKSFLDLGNPGLLIISHDLPQRGSVVKDELYVSYVSAQKK